MSTPGDVSGVANRLEKMLIASGSGAATTAMKSNAKDTEGDTEKNSKCCAACGKDGDGLKKCTACKSVWYCNVSCQKAHRKAHVKMCKRIEKILKEEQQPAVGSKMSKDEDSTEEEKGNDTRNTNASEKGDNTKHIIQSRPDCDICMLPLPPPKIGSSYMPCCGKTLCSGCIFVHNRINEDEEHWPKCPFCRAPECAAEEEFLALVKQRAALDDVEAIKKLAHYHLKGMYGMPLDAAKAVELFRLKSNVAAPTHISCLERSMATENRASIRTWQRQSNIGRKVPHSAIRTATSNSAWSRADVAPMLMRSSILKLRRRQVSVLGWICS